jgi:hypothetical protein
MPFIILEDEDDDDLLIYGMGVGAKGIFKKRKEKKR